MICQRVTNTVIGYDLTVVVCEPVERGRDLLCTSQHRVWSPKRRLVRTIPEIFMACFVAGVDGLAGKKVCTVCGEVKYGY